MQIRHFFSRFSLHSYLLSAFLVLALVLGGGGSPNPLTEILLQLAFVVFAGVWILVGAPSSEPQTGMSRGLLAILIMMIALPVLQLMPLPPGLWQSFPGRSAQVEALSLIGEQDSWRSLSLSPTRTLASLLAIVPAAFCAYAIHTLPARQRFLPLVTILVLALATALIGVMQLAAPAGGLTLYPYAHRGWIVGFQANRNATADVLLIGTLVLAFIAVSRLQPDAAQKWSGRWIAVLAACAVFLLSAVIMTGSRTGVLMIPLVLLTAIAMVWLKGSASSTNPARHRLLAGLGGLFALTALGALAVFGGGFGRTFERFAIAGDDIRPKLWEDTIYAIQTYWPAGFGLGGFQPAMLPAEQLENLDPTIPNRAHNDYLEFILEAGLPGGILLLAALVTIAFLVFRNWRADPMRRNEMLLGLGILAIITLHSLVDYPLRSMAVGCLAGIGLGLLPGRSSRSSDADDALRGRVSA